MIAASYDVAVKSMVVVIVDQHASARAHVEQQRPKAADEQPTRCRLCHCGEARTWTFLVATRPIRPSIK